MYTVTYTDTFDRVNVCRFNFLADAEGFALSRGVDFLSLTWEEIDHPDYEPCI